MKRWEFKKKLALWAAVIGTLSAVAPYILSAFDKEPVESASQSIFTACIGYLISYAGASLGEKVSRNRHGLDADGNPLSTPTDDTNTDESISG